MKLKFLLLILSFSSLFLFSQDYNFGKVVTEDGVPIPYVTIINIHTEQRAQTDLDGNYMIKAKSGELIRYVKNGYGRFDEVLTADNFTKNNRITLIKLAEEIEEVTISKKLSGNLEADSKMFDGPAKTKKLNEDMVAYIKRPSSASVLSAKPGEFRQPIAQGFSIGKIKDKWDDVDLMLYVINALGENYFIELGVDKQNIQSFVLYVIDSGFERKRILKYGYCSQSDLGRFQGQILKKIDDYLSNAPRNKKK